MLDAEAAEIGSLRPALAVSITGGRGKDAAAVSVRGRTMKIETIGFVGLGAMGAPMARNLAAAGYRLKGFDIDPEARRRSALPEVVTSLAAAATDADVVVTML